MTRRAYDTASTVTIKSDVLADGPCSKLVARCNMHQIVLASAMSMLPGHALRCVC